MSDHVQIANAPDIPGLIFRRFRSEGDYSHISSLIHACKGVDGLERSVNADDIARVYRHLENFDPHADMLFAELDGQVIGHGRVRWEELDEGIRIYHLAGSIHPALRGKGIGAALWEAGENRLIRIAAGHPKSAPAFFQVEIFETEGALASLVESRGYLPVRYETHMLCDLGQDLPEVPLKRGLELRPVQAEHLRPIFDASNEAFRDHWGYLEQGEEEFQSQLEDPDFHPELWKVAWDGDQIACVIHNFIDEKENIEYKRRRGYTEGICTRRPWRKMGLARALLVRSMRMFKDMGMSETALSVDSENISGALGLYESVGYRTVKREVVYRKSLEPSG